MIKTELKNKYVIGKLLKNASRTYEAKNKQTGQSYAVKIVDLRQMSFAEQTKLEELLQKVQRIKHPHYIRIIDIIKQQTFIYIVQEYVENSSIKYVAGLLTTPLLLNYAWQLVQALLSFQIQQFFINDFTIENVSINKLGALKIQLLKLKPERCCSPEQALGQVMTTKANVFNLGLILYNLATGERHRMEDNRELLTSYAPEVESDSLKCDARIKFFIKQCLVKNVEERSGVAQLFTSNKWLGEYQECAEVAQKVDLKKEAIPLELPESSSDSQQNATTTNTVTQSTFNQNNPSNIFTSNSIALNDIDDTENDIKPKIKTNAPLQIKRPVQKPHNLREDSCIATANTVHLTQLSIQTTNLNQNDDESVDITFKKGQKIQIQKPQIKKKFEEFHIKTSQSSLLLIDESRFKTDFLKGWREIFQSIDGNALIHVDRLQQLFNENSDFFLNLFEKFLSVNSLLKVFKFVNLQSDTFKAFLKLVNEMQLRDVDFALKCQVVGYQYVFIQFFTQLIFYKNDEFANNKIQSCVIEFQSILFDYVKIQTRYVFAHTNKNQNKMMYYENQFVLFINNGGVFLLQILMQIDKYAFLEKQQKSQNEFQNYIFEYFNDVHNYLLQQQIQTYLIQIMSISNMKSWIFRLLTQGADVQNEEMNENAVTQNNFMYSLLNVVYCILTNIKQFKKQENIIKLTEGYLDILIGCLTYCNTSQKYQNETLIQLLKKVFNLVLENFNSIPLKNVLMLNLKCLSQVMQPKDPVFSNLIWTYFDVEMFEQLLQCKNNLVIAETLNIIHSKFIIGSSERRQQFFSSGILNLLIVDILQQKDQMIQPFIYSMLSEFFKNETLLTVLLQKQNGQPNNKNDALIRILYEEGLFLLKTSNTWTQFATQILAKLSEYKDILQQIHSEETLSYDNEYKQRISSLLEGINQKTWKMIGFTHPQTVDNLQKIFQNNKCLMLKIFNESFAQLIFNTMKKSCTQSTMMLSCLKLLKTIFSQEQENQQFQEQVTSIYQKFKPMFDLIVQNAPEKIIDATNQIIKIMTVN